MNIRAFLVALFSIIWYTMGMKTKLMMMVAAVAVAFGARAETETVGGYTWTYEISGGSAEVMV